ncbi:chymotrypsin-2-like isoform X8 [Pieris napi]|uniref:chymotrypsin-2-like isoform X8 n=1 Tax=Pieris napi TaxID=78633 RepID=UPI001FBA6FD1|nr:chymotrypsin-2-like isoform X8 [Pieris napi]
MVFGFTMLKSSVLFIALLAAILVEAKDVSREKVPYVVSIREAANHICSGTILRGNWVLTSPQYVYDKQPKDLLVVMGTVDKTDSKALSVHVKKIEVHPNNNYINLAYSLALLKTKEDISYSKLVLPIELPTAPTRIGKNLIAIGWKLKGDKKPTNKLQVKNVTSLSTKISPHESALAIKNNEGFDTDEEYFSDIGGPVVNKNKQIVGVIQIMFEPPTKPSGLCARVYDGLQWINKMLKDNY